MQGRLSRVGDDLSGAATTPRTGDPACSAPCIPPGAGCLGPSRGASTNPQLHYWLPSWEPLPAGWRLPPSQSSCTTGTGRAAARRRPQRAQQACRWPARSAWSAACAAPRGRGGCSRGSGEGKRRTRLTQDAIPSTAGVQTKLASIPRAAAPSRSASTCSLTCPAAARRSQRQRTRPARPHHAAGRPARQTAGSHPGRTWTAGEGEGNAIQVNESTGVPACHAAARQHPAPDSAALSPCPPMAGCCMLGS